MNKNTLTPEQEASISNAKDQMEYHLREAAKFDAQLKKIQRSDLITNERIRAAKFTQSRRDQHRAQYERLKKYLEEYKCV